MQPTANPGPCSRASRRPCSCAACRASRRRALLLAGTEQLAVAGWIARIERGLLRRRELDVADPEADRADRDADPLGDDAQRQALLAAQLPGEVSLIRASRTHVRMQLGRNRGNGTPYS